MKSTKLVLVAAVIGALGLGGLAQVVQAQRSQPQVAVVPHHTSEVAEASDGDGETNGDVRTQRSPEMLPNCI